MASVGRLAGAILAETQGNYFLVGGPKEPCAWAAAGFHAPEGLDDGRRPFVKLSSCGPVTVPAPRLTLTVEGPQLAHLLVRRFVIARHASVSERLWRLVIGANEDGTAQGEIDARWLGEIPDAVWDVVRDAVLRCV